MAGSHFAVERSLNEASTLGWSSNKVVFHFLVSVSKWDWNFLKSWNNSLKIFTTFFSCYVSWHLLVTTRSSCGIKWAIIISWFTEDKEQAHFKVCGTASESEETFPEFQITFCSQCCPLILLSLIISFTSLPCPKSLLFMNISHLLFPCPIPIKLWWFGLKKIKIHIISSSKIVKALIYSKLQHWFVHCVIKLKPCIWATLNLYSLSIVKSRSEVSLLWGMI